MRYRRIYYNTQIQGVPMDPASWSVAAPAVGSAFIASLVEVVEAFTIVLAVGTLRGWRPAAFGTIAALGVLGALIASLGPLLSLVPLHLLQLVIGILLLLFGMGWLRKAILRAAGIIPLHDEDAIFASEAGQLGNATGRRRASLDWIAGLTAFKAVLLEGLEVVFIVIAVGAGNGLLVRASIGAIAACVLVFIIGVFIRRPLARVPENTLKFAVGVMLSTSHQSHLIHPSRWNQRGREIARFLVQKIAMKPTIAPGARRRMIASAYTYLLPRCGSLLAKSG
jgi:Ca2+/H+ antiporter, TMEM165/GDT1 family